MLSDDPEITVVGDPIGYHPMFPETDRIVKQQNTVLTTEQLKTIWVWVEMFFKFLTIIQIC